MTIDYYTSRNTFVSKNIDQDINNINEAKTMAAGYSEKSTKRYVDGVLAPKWDKATLHIDGSTWIDYENGQPSAWSINAPV